MMNTEQKLYALIDAAEQQQALATQQQDIVQELVQVLVQRSGQLGESSQALQRLSGGVLEQAAAQGATAGAVQAVKASLQTELAKACGQALDTVKTASQPMLASLAGVQQQAQQVQATLQQAQGELVRNLTLWAVVVGLGLLLVLGSVAYGLLWWQRGELEQLRADIDQAQQTLVQLQQKTGNARYVQAQDGRFILGPKGSKAATCKGDVPCIQLP